MKNDVQYLREAPSFVNVTNVCLVTFIIQHYWNYGGFLLCKITNLLIYSKRKIADCLIISGV